MEWKSNLRRTQSLRSVPSSCDKPILTGAGLRDRKASVSQLVARYQTTVEVNTSIEVTSTNYAEPKLKQVQQEITLHSTTTMKSPRVSSLLDGEPENKLVSLLNRNNEKERSLAKTGLSRSKSMGSLESSTGSIGALKALFESKAGTPHKVKSTFRATSYTPLSKAADIMPLNREIEERNTPAEKQKEIIPTAAAAAAPDKDAEADVKEDEMTLKVVNQTRIMRRKAIGGIDFETITASQADDKRRSIADFRDSSLTQAKEKLPVSVKAMSALYLSKVAPAEPTGSPLKQAQNQSSDSGNRVKITKMAENSQQMKGDILPPPSAIRQPGTGDISVAHSQPSMPSQPSKEMLYQQRQKCELRRLLKHTHPELKMLDVVVDEELAEVLSSDSGLTAAETGYEGEVLSRRWIFENCAMSNKVDPHTPKMHLAVGTVERGDVNRTSALFEQPGERLHEESVKWIMDAGNRPNSNPDLNAECEEEMVRVDVQSTRKMFESQSVDTSWSSPDNKFEGKVVISEDETGAVQKRKNEFEICSKQNLSSKNKSSSCIRSLDVTEQPHVQKPCTDVLGPSTRHEFYEDQQYRKWVSTGEAVFENQSTSPPNSEGCGEIIETSAALVRNNPFISTNIAKEQSLVLRAKTQHNPLPYGDPAVDSGAVEDILTANVKNRAHLFESMPFDKIRHQNKEDMETMVESINETLNSLYHFSAIHSDGSIIEVNDTMIAKKAKYILSQSGPKINYDDVAEGGAQNFILQLLPRANLKPQVIYLKEDNQGNVEATMVNVPVHQHQFTTNQDAEFKTANVVQLIEDILNQDNSLRKGVIIQQDVNRCAEVIVYSLYNYAEGDVKSYCPPQGHSVEPDDAECAIGDVNKMENQEVIKGDVKSTINYLLATTQDQTFPGSIRPEVTLKGNVKLFKSCIEKGEYEYLKTLQAEPTVQEQELSTYHTQTVAGGRMETKSKQGDHQTEEIISEWAPVDVKRLKNMFSADQNYVQPKQMIHDDVVHSAKISPALTCQSMTLGKRSSTECDITVFPHSQVKNTFIECGGQAQEKTSDFKVAPQESYLETQDEGMVHQPELVELVDDKDEISNLQAAIDNLKQAAMEAKSSHDVSKEKHQLTSEGLSKEHIASTVVSDVMKNHKVEAGLAQKGVQNEKTCSKPMLRAPSSASYITSEYKSESQQGETETCHVDNDSEEKQTIEACGAEGQQGTEVVQDLDTAMMSLQSSATKLQHEDKEDVVQGNLQAALDALERSNINVNRGDFRAAMIYRNSSKSHKERCKIVDVKMSVQKPTEKEFCPESISTPCVTFRQEGQVATEELSAPNAEPSRPGQTPDDASSEKSRRPVGPKPAIPPKPEYLVKVKCTDNQSANTENLVATQTTTMTTEMKKQSKKEKPPQPLPTTSMSYKDALKKGLSNTESVEESISNLLIPEKPETNELVDEAIQASQEIQVNHQAQSSFIDVNTGNQSEDMNATVQEKCPQNHLVKGNGNETDESHVDFHEACQKFGGKNELLVKNAPIKPKRVRIAQSENKNSKHTFADNSTYVDAEPQPILTGPSYSKPNTHGQRFDNNEHKKDMKEENKVVMRERKVKMETEDERRQRLSVHMDEIMRGNMTAAIEIFDNLRKQEELQNILTKVEEIEQDTSKVDVRSLRTIFENVPAWVVKTQEKKQKQAKVEYRVDRSPLWKDDTESMSSMAHVFGDLERASEEIMNLKEQTLARLMDIEEAIKKALYSVSTLKSDSDIVGLSGLFKESLETVQGSPSSGNIKKISIGSSRTKTPQAQASSATQRNTGLPVGQTAGLEVPSGKPQASSPSSPAFISIQSAARKKEKTQALPPEATTCSTCQHSPKIDENFRTTKTLKCNSAAQNKNSDLRKGGKKQSSYCPDSPLSPKRELSVLEVQTDPKGNGIIGTKMVTENYERTVNFDNRFYSSKTCTVVTTQPETTTSSRGQVVTSPATYQVTTYPEVQLPINKKP